MGRRNGSKKHLRRLAGPIWFWLTVELDNVGLYPHPSKLPPLLDENGVAAVGFQNADEQEKAYRYLTATRQSHLDGFVQRFEKGITRREILVVAPADLPALIA
jgi:hypothetical protein